MSTLANLLLLLVAFLVPTALIIRFTDFSLGFIFDKLGLMSPLRNLFHMGVINLLRLISGGLVLYLMGISIQVIGIAITSIAAVVIIGSIITGLAGDIIAGILLVKQTGLRPGLRLKVCSFGETTAKVITVKKLDLLNLQGILQDHANHAIEIVPYWYLRQSGFQLISKGK